MGSEARAASMQ